MEDLNRNHGRKRKEAADPGEIVMKGKMLVEESGTNTESICRVVERNSEGKKERDEEEPG